jgi:hypothetical protein
VNWWSVVSWQWCQDKGSSVCCWCELSVFAARAWAGCKGKPCAGWLPVCRSCCTMSMQRAFLYMAQDAVWMSLSVASRAPVPASK